MADVFDIAGRINSTSNERVVTTADQIKDEDKNKKQSQINAETISELATHESRLNAYTEGKFVTVDTYSGLPATGAVDTVYRVSSWDGTANSGQGAVDITKYSEYAWENGAYKFLDVKTQIGEVFDISEYNNDTYTDLEDALSGTNVPQDVRRGGMSIKFVQSSDNKYVQYRLMSDTFSTTVSDWQGVDDEPTLGSRNFVESGSVEIATNKPTNEITLDIVSVITTGENLYNTNSKANVVGYLFERNGIVEAASYGYSHLIRVTPGAILKTKYKDGNIIQRFVFLDAVGNVVSTDAGTAVNYTYFSATVPATAKYVIVNYRLNNRTNMIITEATYPSEFVPFVASSKLIETFGLNTKQSDEVLTLIAGSNTIASLTALINAIKEYTYYPNVDAKQTDFVNKTETINLFNYRNKTNGIDSLWRSSGIETANGYGYSHFIKVNPGDIIKISTGGGNISQRFNFFDINYNFVTSSNGSEESEYYYATVPNNCYYAIVNYRTNTPSQIIITTSDFPSSFVPFISNATLAEFFRLNNTQKSEVVEQITPLINEVKKQVYYPNVDAKQSDFVTEIGTVNLFDKENIKNGVDAVWRPDNEGGIEPLNGYGYSHYIKVTAGDVVKCTYAKGNISPRFSFFDENYNFVSRSVGTAQGSSYWYETVPANCCYVIVNYRSSIVDSLVITVAETFPSNYVPFIQSATLAEYFRLNNTQKAEVEEIAMSHASLLPVYYAESEDVHYVRAEYNDTYDCVITFAVSTSLNKNFSLRLAKLIPKSTALSDTISVFEAADVFKSMEDDIAPMVLQEIYIGGNHGNPNFIKATCQHDKTEADIGSIWSDGTHNYTIVTVNTGYLVIAYVNNGIVEYMSATGTLQHISGGTHTSDIVVTACAEQQLQPCGNMRECIITDGNGKVMVSGGTCNKLVVHEKYNILDGAAIVTYLQSNVGNNTNTSYYENNVSTIMAIVDNVYEFNRNSSITLYGGLYIGESNKLSFYAFSQCMKLANEFYAYVPDSTNISQLTSFTVGDADLRINVDEKIPYRYYEITKDYSKGFGIVFNTQLGYGKPALRDLYVKDPGHYKGSTGKLYPYLICPKAVYSAGTYFTGVAGRVFVHATASVPNKSWYFVGDDIILAVDVVQGFSDFISLPEYMQGMKIENLDISTDVTVVNDFVVERGIRLINSGNTMGYAVLRLYK